MQASKYPCLANHVLVSVLCQELGLRTRQKEMLPPVKGGDRQAHKQIRDLDCSRYHDWCVCVRTRKRVHVCMDREWGPGRGRPSFWG